MKTVSEKSKEIKASRIGGTKVLMSLLVADGWFFLKEGKNWKATSPAGQYESHRSLKKLLLNCSWHPMYL